MIERKLVAWCLQCREWYPASEIGRSCGNDCPLTLVKRRPWVCSVCGHSAKLKRDVHDGGACRGDGGWN